MFFRSEGPHGGVGGLGGSKLAIFWSYFGQFWSVLVQIEILILFSGEFGPKLTFFAFFVKIVGFWSENANPSGDSHTKLNFLAESPECTLGPPPGTPYRGVWGGQNWSILVNFGQFLTPHIKTPIKSHFS